MAMTRRPTSTIEVIGLQATNTVGYIAMSGATLRELADLLGHVNVQMTMRYAHLMPSHTQNVVARMMQKFLMDTPCEAGDER